MVSSSRRDGKGRVADMHRIVVPTLRRINPRFLAIGLLLGAVAPLSAQPLPDMYKKIDLGHSAPIELISAEALIAIGWSGADALEPSFRNTALGEIIAEPRVQELCGALWPSIETLLREKTDDAEEREYLLLLREAFSLLWAQPVAVSFLGLEIIEGEPVPQVAISLRGEAGAKRIYEAMENIRVREDAPAEPYPGATSAKRMSVDGLPAFLTYGVERGCFFLAIGDKAASSAIAQIRREAPSLATQPQFQRAWQQTVAASTAAKWAYVDGAGILAHAKHHLANSDAVLPPPIQALLQDDALGRLGSVLFSVGIEGDGFRRSCFIGWRSDADPGPPLDDETLVFVPKDTSFFSYEDCDIAGLLTTAKSFVEGIDPDAGRKVRSLQAFADGFLGFRLEQDLIANLGRRFLIFEEPTSSGIIPGICWVLRPNDGETIEMCVRRVTTSLGAIAGLKGIGVSVNERAGISFIETSGAPSPIAPAWAARGDRLLLALHPAVLEEVLHRVDAPDARERSILANPDFLSGRTRIAHDQHGLFYTDTPAVVAELYPTLLPFLQAGVAGLGGQVTGLSAGQLPPPYMVNERMFGDIHGYRRTGDGWLWEAHGPLPFTLPDLGSFTALIAAGAVIPVVLATRGVEQVAEMRSTAAVHHHEAFAQMVFMGCQQAIAQTGAYPQTLGELVEAGHVDESMIRSGETPFWVYSGRLPLEAKGAVLFHGVQPTHGDKYIYCTTEGQVDLVDKETLDALVKNSNWPARTRF